MLLETVKINKRYSLSSDDLALFGNFLNSAPPMTATGLSVVLHDSDAGAVATLELRLVNFQGGCTSVMFAMSVSD